MIITKDYSAFRMYLTAYEKKSGLNRSELDVFAALGWGPLGKAELMKSAILFDMTQSTLYRTLKTLLAKGRIENVKPGSKYQVIEVI